MISCHYYLKNPNSYSEDEEEKLINYCLFKLRFDKDFLKRWNDKFSNVDEQNKDKTYIKTMVELEIREQLREEKFKKNYYKVLKTYEDRNKKRITW